ncbi:MAG TPA: hypothetical protein PLK31_03585 [Chloroflexota bacterium]|nr:hypothetical protein [Chloroflexota bacterium]
MDEETGEWWYAVVDVIEALTDSQKPRDYWYRMKKRVAENEGIQLSTICRQFKLKAPNVGITRRTAKPIPSPTKTWQRFGRVDVLLGKDAHGRCQPAPAFSNEYHTITNGSHSIFSPFLI